MSDTKKFCFHFFYTATLAVLINNHTHLYWTMSRAKLLRWRNRNRHTRITATARMWRIAIVPTQIWSQRNVSLSQWTLIRRTEHTICWMYCWVRTRRWWYIQRFVAYDWYGMTLTQQGRITGGAVQGVTANHCLLLLLLLKF